jgi:hypothetical protein
VDVISDPDTGAIFACGHTYSTQYSIGGDQDIVVFKFEPESMSYISPDGWSLIWGSTLTETATGIATDGTSVFVSGYTNSVGTISNSKFDMIILKINAGTGILSQAMRIGNENNDKANGITYFLGYLYIVGESDSIGWASPNARTDMTFF